MSEWSTLVPLSSISSSPFLAGARKDYSSPLLWSKAEPCILLYPIERDWKEHESLPG